MELAAARSAIIERALMSFGVDHRYQKHYPFHFIKADALEYAKENGEEFDVIHASPPCQGYSPLRHLPWLKGKEYPMLINPTRDLLCSIGKPWIMENVEGAPLVNPVVLCGLMFGLRLLRHRKFESSHLLLQPKHVSHSFYFKEKRRHDKQSWSAYACGAENKQFVDHKGYVRTRTKSMKMAAAGADLPDILPVCETESPLIAGHQSIEGGIAQARKAMGIDWMNREELSQAIPPAYTEFLGRQIINAL